MKKGDKITLKIEKLVYEGAGLGKIGGFPVFVENTCPEDVVEAEITAFNKNFARAKLIEIKEPSPRRVKPFCPIHNACGGCGWQFIDYDFQLEQKRNIVGIFYAFNSHCFSISCIFAYRLLCALLFDY